jgi:hypothetical protein
MIAYCASLKAAALSMQTIQNRNERGWRGGPEANFLKTVHTRACRYFHAALSPDYNAAHRDHFHLDRGMLWVCK